jgi:hypothetical protein
MKTSCEKESRESCHLGNALFLAGERVSAGEYREIETGRVICLDQEDYLPASLDGHVACYKPVSVSWGRARHDIAYAVVRAGESTDGHKGR